MLRKFISFSMAALLVVSVAPSGSAATGIASKSEARLAEKVKAGIVRLGVGREARVKLKLKNKTKLAGYISEIGEDYFVVTDLDTLKETPVAYPDVIQVQGNNLTTRTKIIIAASIIVGVIITLYLVRGAFCDGC